MRQISAAALLSFAALFIGSCGKAASNTNADEIAATSSLPASSQSSRPMRIVSLDFCADQYVLKLVEPSRILALSPDAAAPFSYMRDAAAGLKTVRSTAEDVMILKPDLVVRSYGGGPNAEKFFARAGVPVLNVGWAGSVEDIKRVTLEMASGLDAKARGDDIIKDMDARLAALKPQDEDIRVLYMTPSGTTTGSGLVQDMIEHAGLKNFEPQAGWRSLPLERLAYEQPDMIAAAFFDTNPLEHESWSAMRHPVARAQLKTLPTAALNGSWMSCGGWFALDAIEALAGSSKTSEGL